MSTLRQLPATVNIHMVVGDTLNIILSVTDDNNAPYDLTGHTITAALKNPGASPQALTITETDLSIGSLTATITPTISTSIVAGARWDLQSVDGDGAIKTLVRGSVHGVDQVTV